MIVIKSYTSGPTKTLNQNKNPQTDMEFKLAWLDKMINYTQNQTQKTYKSSLKVGDIITNMPIIDKLVSCLVRAYRGLRQFKQMRPLEPRIAVLLISNEKGVFCYPAWYTASGALANCGEYNRGITKAWWPKIQPLMVWIHWSIIQNLDIPTEHCRGDRGSLISLHTALYESL